MNVLYDKQTSRAKVADFGMTRKLQTASSYRSRKQLASSPEGLNTGMVGTIHWMAPEVSVTILMLQIQLRECPV